MPITPSVMNISVRWRRAMLREFVQWYWGTTRWVGVLYLAIIVFLFLVLCWIVTEPRFDVVCTARNGVEVVATPSMPGVKAK